MTLCENILLSVFSNDLIIQWGYITHGTTATLPISYTQFYKAAVSLADNSANTTVWAHLSFWKVSLSTIKCNNGGGASNDYILIGV